MRLLALMSLAALTILGGCDNSDPADALNAKIEEEKKIAAERRKKDDPTTFIVEEPEDIELGLELLEDESPSKDE